MNWLVIGLNYFNREIREAGDDFRFVPCRISNDGLTYIPHVVTKLRSEGFQPDAVFLGDFSGPPGIYGLEMLDIPSAFFCIDPHFHIDWYQYWAQAWDLMLVAESDYIPQMKLVAPSTPTVRYPLFGRNDAPPERERDIPVAFVGTRDKDKIPEREEFFLALENRIPLSQLTGDWREPYSRAKIVVNFAQYYDLNFRHFEAMSSGALLIAERIQNGMPELFKDGEHFVGYDYRNWDELVDKVHYYLAHDEERERIAKAGQALVLQHHTPRERYRQLRELIQSPEVKQRLRERLADPVSARYGESEAFSRYGKRLNKLQFKLIFEGMAARVVLQNPETTDAEKLALFQTFSRQDALSFAMNQFSRDIGDDPVMQRSIALYKTFRRQH